MNAQNKSSQQPIIGIVQWFHKGEHQKVEQTIKNLKELNVQHLRTGISWADYYSEGGHEWYDWLIPKLAKEVEILPCFLYTPPSVGEQPKISSPPKDTKLYADDLDNIINRYGKYFGYIEIWNEPNNKSEWDFTLDPGFKKFADMAGKAAYWAKQLGKKTVLGGMSPIDPAWLSLMGDYKLLPLFDVVGIHGFPNVFDFSWEGWEENINRVRKVLDYHKVNPEIWITETGFSTWQYDELKQLNEFKNLLNLPVERAYWYSLFDLEAEKDTVDGFHLDDREYYFGLQSVKYQPKLLYNLWKNDGLASLSNHEWLTPTLATKKEDKKSVLITGGAGFIGTNMADHLLSNGESVTILDNLGREGVSKNLQWLKDKHGDLLNVKIADIRNKYIVKEVVENASHIYHFAAQVAVTTSVINPREDYKVNIEGTFNILEAMKDMRNPPSLLFTSTNKVYGNLADLEIKEKTRTFGPQDSKFANGIDETRALDFHSPYGCSKGSADQYVLDFSRIYRLPTTVFRMSCMYGPHQCGSEDQGWVANFLIRAIKGQTINIYGNGKQVRDILFIDDLITAMELARKNIKNVSGQAFNIGGGSENSVSLLEVLDIIEDLHGDYLNIKYGDWRPGDQLYYVSDTSKFTKLTGWQPKVNYKDGIRKLYEWLLSTRNINKKPKSRLKSVKIKTGVKI